MTEVSGISTIPFCFLVSHSATFTLALYWLKILAEVDGLKIQPKFIPVAAKNKGCRKGLNNVFFFFFCRRYIKMGGEVPVIADCILA